MENRVRDLEQMEERDPEDRGRRIGMVAMATLGIVGLTFAMGVVVGKAAEPADGAAKDPLDQLDRVAGVAAKPTPGALAEKAEAGAAVDAADLTFPKALTEEEDRPEVLAALEAAAREEATLEQAAAPTPAPTAPVELEAEEAPEVEQAAELEDEGSPEERTERRMQAVLPAAVAAGSAGRAVVKAVKHDQLVAAALPVNAPRERAPHGEEGAFTLQVISYDAPAPAQSFASSLRTKGHEAFVASADVPGRGRYYRVRIGPFATRERAEAYRRKFEDDEHMNTIVVKRAKEDAER